MIFSKTKSFDPYLEKSETLWLLHWMLASDPFLLLGIIFLIIIHQ